MSKPTHALIKSQKNGEDLCDILLEYIEIDRDSPIQVLLGKSKEDAQSALIDLRILLSSQTNIENHQLREQLNSSELRAIALERNLVDVQNDAKAFNAIINGKWQIDARSLVVILYKGFAGAKEYMEFCKDTVEDRKVAAHKAILAAMGST